MSGAATNEKVACLIEAELAIDCEANFSGVTVVLAIVFPPANRAQNHGGGRIESPVPAARATVENPVPAGLTLPANPLTMK